MTQSTIRVFVLIRAGANSVSNIQKMISAFGVRVEDSVMCQRLLEWSQWHSGQVTCKKQKATCYNIIAKHKKTFETF